MLYLVKLLFHALLQYSKKCTFLIGAKLDRVARVAILLDGSNVEREGVSTQNIGLFELSILWNIDDSKFKKQKARRLVAYSSQEVRRLHVLAPRQGLRLGIGDNCPLSPSTLSLRCLSSSPSLPSLSSLSSSTTTFIATYQHLQRRRNLSPIISAVPMYITSLRPFCLLSLAICMKQPSCSQLTCFLSNLQIVHITQSFYSLLCSSLMSIMVVLAILYMYSLLKIFTTYCFQSIHVYPIYLLIAIHHNKTSSKDTCTSSSPLYYIANNSFSSATSYFLYTLYKLYILLLLIYSLSC